MSEIAIAIIWILRVVLAGLTMFFPFVAGWSNFILDVIDGDILQWLGLGEETYQLTDKFFDWLAYVGMALAAWRFQWGLRKWMYGFFALRTVGQALFFITGDTTYFFFFPNFLEPLFLIYSAIFFFKGSEEAKAYAVYLKYRWYIWIFVIVYKMQEEFITHIAEVDRLDFIRENILPLFS